MSDNFYNSKDAVSASEADASSSDLAECVHPLDHHPNVLYRTDGYTRWVFDAADPVAAKIREVIHQQDMEGNLDWVDDEMECVRQGFAAIDDTEQLSLEFISGEWWDCRELRDELRRACAGGGEYSSYLARRVGFEFMVGNLIEVFYDHYGPLTRPLEFTSKYPEMPTWNEQPTILNEPSRRDASKFYGLPSYMLH